MTNPSDTAQQLCRTEFDKQYTKDMLRDLVKRTIALVKRYERFTPRRSTDTAEDRIHAAVMKFLDGARTWDPSRVDLCGFLLGVIASDLTSEMRRSKMAPMISLHARSRPREDDYTGELCEESSADARSSNENGWPSPLAPESVDEAWSLAMTHLHERANGDADVLALLGSYEDGVTQKREVMKRLGWSAAKYKRVYQRLLQLADALDPSVREAIAYAFVN